MQWSRYVSVRSICRYKTDTKSERELETYYFIFISMSRQLTVSRMCFLSFGDPRKEGRN